MAQVTKMTTVALAAARDAIKDLVNTDYLYLGIGDDDTAPTAGDTDLGNAIIRKVRQETSVLAASRTVSAWINSIEGNGNTIKEVGTFEEATGGVIHDHTVLDSGAFITKTNTVEVWIDNTITPTVTDAS